MIQKRNGSAPIVVLMQSDLNDRKTLLDWGGQEDDRLLYIRDELVIRWLGLAAGNADFEDFVSWNLTIT